MAVEHPVQLIVNMRRRWQAWAARTEPPPPYDQLLLAGASDVASLAGYATGNVQAAYEAGRAVGQGLDAAWPYALRGLDLLWDHMDKEDQRIAALGEDAPPELLVPVQPPPELLQQIVHMRELALAERDRGMGAAAVALTEQAELRQQAQAYEQGAVGPPPEQQPVRL